MPDQALGLLHGFFPPAVRTDHSSLRTALWASAAHVPAPHGVFFCQGTNIRPGHTAIDAASRARASLAPTFLPITSRLTEHQRMSDSLEDGLDHGDTVLLQITHLVAKHFTEPGA